MSAPISQFAFPTQILFGSGALEQLPGWLRRLRISNPLVVTDEGLLKTPAFARLVEVLGGPAGERWFLYSGVQPNPGEDEVIEGAGVYKKHRCDGVIAFGGGSALDVGKAVRLLVKQPALRLSEFNPQEDWSGLAPCVCIPTTAGTGSEVGRSSVVTLEKTQRKAVLFHPELLAKLAILDPELTRSLPAALTAATGADALVHCIESFTSPLFHPLCDGIALEGIRLIVQALPRACRDGNDMEARGHMLVAAAMGAVAFQKDLGATHSLAHPLSTLKGLHHGLANAMCLPAVLRFNAEKKPGLYRRVGMACGIDVFSAPDAEADRRTIEFLSNFLRDLGLEPRLRDHGVSEEDIPALVEQAIADPCHLTNPAPVSAEDMRRLYADSL